MRSKQSVPADTMIGTSQSLTAEMAKTLENGACPLCSCRTASESWLGETRYLGRKYGYVQCASCGSLFCSPMPDPETIARMYGLNYAGEAAGADTIDPKNPRAVVGYLSSREPGVFVDYGCGDGRLLVAAHELGWTAVGVELSPEVARATEQRTGITVRTPSAPELVGIADVLHLGDVVEHLTNMDRQLADALSVLKSGGTLLAQGPLENNPNVFTATVRLARRFRKRIMEMAPYHVVLATSKGQRVLFARMNLEELAYTVTEETWPAPRRFFSGARGMALYSLRRLSQAVSAISREGMGNRYFYIGRRR